MRRGGGREERGGEGEKGEGEGERGEGEGGGGWDETSELQQKGGKLFFLLDIRESYH